MLICQCCFAIVKVLLKKVTYLLTYLLTDNGIHRTLRGRVGTELGVHRRHEIPEVGRLVGTTPAGAWRHTLGMSTVLDDAAATSRLLCEVDWSWCRCSSNAQVMMLDGRNTSPAPLYRGEWVSRVWISQRLLSQSQIFWTKYATVSSGAGSKLRLVWRVSLFLPFLLPPPLSSPSFSLPFPSPFPARLSFP